MENPIGKDPIEKDPSQVTYAIVLTALIPVQPVRSILKLVGYALASLGSRASGDGPCGM